MRKNIYILAFVLIFSFLAYQPAKNAIYEYKRVKNEAFINEYLSDKSFKRSYVKSLPKRLRPDLKNYHDFLMTRDPNTNAIPSERALEALKIKNAKFIFDFCY